MPRRAFECQMPTSAAVITPACRAPVRTAPPIRPAPTMTRLLDLVALTEAMLTARADCRRGAPGYCLPDTGRKQRRGWFRQVVRNRHALQAPDHAVLVAADEERAAQALGPHARVQIAR